MIGDGDLCDLFAHATQLGGYFGTELETATLQMELFQERAAYDFVARCFVVNSRPVKKVGEVGQQLGSEKEAQATFGTIGAHAVDYVRFAFFERTEQLRIILRVIF